MFFFNNKQYLLTRFLRHHKNYITSQEFNKNNNTQFNCSIIMEIISFQQISTSILLEELIKILSSKSSIKSIKNVHTFNVHIFSSLASFHQKRWMAWAHKTNLTPPMFIEMPVLYQEMYLCDKGIQFVSFFDFSIEYLNYFHSVGVFSSYYCSKWFTDHRTMYP